MGIHSGEMFQVLGEVSLTMALIEKLN